MKFYFVNTKNPFLFQKIINRFNYPCDNIENYNGGVGIFVVNTHEVHDDYWKTFVNKDSQLLYLLDDGPEGYPNMLRLEYDVFYKTLDERGVDRKMGIISYNNSIKKGITHYPRYNINTIYTPSFLLNPFNDWKSVSESITPQYDYSLFIRNGRLHKKEAFYKIKEKNLNILVTYKLNRDFTDSLILDDNNDGLLDEFNFHLKPEVFYNSKIHFTVESEYYPKDKEEHYFDNMIHLSEKTYRNISFGLPFVLISTKNSLKCLKEFGFKTFDNFIDESYDNMDDDIRMEYAIDSGIKLLEFYDTQVMKDIIEYNKKLIYDDVHMKNVFESFVLSYLEKYLDN